MTRWVHIVVLLASSAPAGAEGRFTLPLPSPDLPAGVLTVKVVGGDLRDLKVGQPVELLLVKGTQSQLVATVPTGEDGRAHFGGIEPGKTYAVQVKVGDAPLRSGPLIGPPSGGLRLLLSLAGEGTPSGAMPPAGKQDLPTGHPPAGKQDLPAGHPPTGPRDLPAGHPATGAGQPHLGPAAGRSGAAVIVVDAAVAAGQIKVLVLRGKAKHPLAGASVALVQEGGKARPLAHTDEQGTTAAPAAVGRRRFTLRVQHDGLTYNSAFVAPSDKGLRATFHVFNRTRDRGRLSLAPGSHWVCQIGEGALRFMQVIQLGNDADSIYDPGAEGLVLPLPAGARNVELPSELKGLAAYDEAVRAVRVTAPLPPGGLSLRVFYEIPYSSRELELRQAIPLPLGASTLVLLNGDAPVHAAGPSIEGRGRQEEGQQGRAFSITPIASGGRLEVTLDGLPHRDRLPLTVTLVLAGLIGLWGILGALGGPSRARQRQTRRERLLQQLAQARRSPKKKGSSAELMRELEQVWEDPS